MKVLLTGTTGFIGGEVLKQCLQNPGITSVVALSRRDLPASIVDGNKKLKVVLMKDFTSYSDEVKSELREVEACIWCLGSATVSSVEEARKMTIDYTLAAAEACKEVARVVNPNGPSAKPFRFIYLSGIIAERDQTKPLWYLQDFRRIRGQLETELLDFASATDAESLDHSFESYIVRPGMVLSQKDSSFSLKGMAGYLIPSVRVDALATTMVSLAIEGSSQRVIENTDLRA